MTALDVHGVASPTPATTPAGGRARRALGNLEPVLGGGGTAFLVSLSAATAGNLVFHAVVSRRLGPDGYGGLSALLAVLMVLSLPMTALQIAITQATAPRIADGDHVGGRTMALRVGVAAIALSVSLAALAPVVGPVLDLGLAPLLWLAAFVVPALVGTVGRGILMAEQRFAYVAAAVVAATVLRLGLAALLVDRPGDSGVATAMAVSTASEIVLAVAFLAGARRRLRDRLAPVRVAWREQRSAALTLGGLWLALGVDVVLARSHLTPHEAGIYAAAATAARLSLFLPQAVASMAHARMSAADRSGGQRILRTSLLVVFVVAAVSTSALAIGGARLTVVLLGSDFHPSTSLLVWLSVVAGLLAVANLLMHGRLATTGRGSLAGWVGAATTVGVATIWNGHPQTLAAAATVGALVTVALVTSELRTDDAAEPDAPAPSDRASVDVTVVVSGIDASPSSQDHVVAVHEVLATSGRSYEVLTASDAVERRAAFLAARGAWVVHDSATGTIDPSGLPVMLDLADFYGADAAVGSRHHPASTLAIPAARRLVVALARCVTRSTFAVSARDAHLGWNAFRRGVLQDALPHSRSSDATFDLELLALAAGFGHRRVIEVPVHRAGRPPAESRRLLIVLRDRDRVRASIRRATSAPERHVVAPTPARALAFAAPRRPLRPEAMCP